MGCESHIIPEWHACRVLEQQIDSAASLEVSTFPLQALMPAASADAASHLLGALQMIMRVHRER